MKYLKTYGLFENEQWNTLSEDEAIDWVKNNSIYKKVIPFYRTELFLPHRRYKTVDPLKDFTEPRVAPNASSNYHNLFVSNLPSWKEFPRRNRSIVFGDRKRGLRHFSDEGEKYRLFPFKGAKIGLVAYDFWEALGGDLPDFSFDIIDDIFRGRNSEYPSDKNWDELYAAIMEKENSPNVNFIKDRLKETIQIELKIKISTDQTIFEMINEAFNPHRKSNPKSNWLKSLEYNEWNFDSNDDLFNDGDTEGYEFWTESECLFVHTMFEDDFIRKLRK